MKRIVAVALLTTLAFGADAIRNAALSAGLKAIPANQYEIDKLIDTNPDNQLSRQKIELGKMLYFDPRLSSSNLISCNTCHNLALGGDDENPTAIGHLWSTNPQHLNSPTVYNAVFNERQMWDGRFANLETQAGGPMVNEVEMASSHELILERIKANPGYLRLFKRVFGRGNAVTMENVQKAIAAFERTLVTPAPFDAYLLGEDNALTKKEKRGLTLFIQKGCTACHTGLGLGGSMQPFPLNGEYKYAHIGGFTGNEHNLTKVPTLRNISQTAPYFHNGAVATLKEAVEIMAQTQLGIELSPNETDDIVTFLQTLKGKKPKIVYPDLPDIE